MTPLVKDLLSFVFQMVGFVNTFWAAYATVTIALLGWIFSSKQVWPRQQRIVIAVAYGLIVAINCIAQFRFNLLLRAAVTELKLAMSLDPALTNVLRDAARDIPILPPAAMLTIHVLVDVTVIYLIWIQERFHQSKAINDANVA